ncbi:hypothetical protein FD35_GL000136 [Furfurilactobacillus rossiae DSM 15814]|uniref:Uncharacterized protein n=1 Tax=Furfurilactobacillus rossiae DSM 15814 TaxID=1114972 RepID=A0A0R1RLK3_9LACO|nr:hypothetical protein FD35_GL000136 [Furfurilactobacillus rossiae DSM 15814]
MAVYSADVNKQLNEMNGKGVFCGKMTAGYVFIFILASLSFVDYLNASGDFRRSFV